MPCTGGSIIFHHVQASEMNLNFFSNAGGLPVHRPTYNSDFISHTLLGCTYQKICGKSYKNMGGLYIAHLYWIIQRNTGRKNGIKARCLHMLFLYRRCTQISSAA